MLGACSGDAGEPDRGRTGSPSGGDAEETAKVRTLPEDGALSAGRYATGERFEPSFSFELGEGWLVLPTSEPGSLKLGYAAPGQEVAQGKALRFLDVREVFEPREQDGDVLFEAKPAPDDLVAWLQRHPYVGIEEPEPVSIGGISGKRLGAEVDVPEGYRDVREGGCAVPCIPLLRLGRGSVTHITEKGKDSLIVLKDVEGETVVVIISAPADKLDEFLPDAQKVLRNVEWKGA
ncbi:MAG: hypothetical protein M3P49_13800 [Actinomycetota bacterium]|nr:hypothetical protein [Actinomycetota bacterium]